VQRTLISLVVGVALAVIAVVLLTSYVRGLRTEQGTPPAAAKTGAVVVAAADLPFGEKLQPENLKIAEWPSEYIPDDAFRSLGEIFGDEGGDRRIVLRPMVRGEPVLKSKVSGFGAKATLSYEVAPGMRAVSIRINDVSGVAGFILPGDHVDVMLTRKPLNSSKASELITDVILQDVVVLGIDQLSNKAQDKPVVARTVTVQVSTEQAQKLALAQEVGTLSLALRNIETVGEVSTNRVETRDLAGGTTRKSTTVRDPGVRIIYGTGQ